MDNTYNESYQAMYKWLRELEATAERLYNEETGFQGLVDKLNGEPETELDYMFQPWAFTMGVSYSNAPRACYDHIMEQIGFFQARVWLEKEVI